MRSLIFVAFIACVSLSVALAGFVVPPVNLKPTKYQKWAHYHWAWVKNVDGNSENVTALMRQYQAHDIPLGAINIDSTWATQYNNFEMDKTRFPDFPGLVQSLHDNGLKVILWATSMVNVENPDYAMGLAKGYFVKNSKGLVRPLKWWHGQGALLDYTNPEAVSWWHGLMDKVLDAGVDGFKCDGTDPYILEYTLTGGAFGHDGQEISYEDYAHAYYRDFFYYTRQKRSDPSYSKEEQDAGLIMSRPVDCTQDKYTKGCTPFSPKDVMYAGWVGDDDGTFPGMRGSLRKVIYSAWVGYANFGNDIGGYRDRGQDKETFLRWAQLGAFLPLMENGGGGEHRPWMYDEQTVDIYRRFAQQHHRLAAYLHTTGANAMDAGTSSLHPVDEQIISRNSSREIVFPEPKTYSYRLGEDVLVHPVIYNAKESAQEALDEKDIHIDVDKGEALVRMAFPATSRADGKEQVWLDWWTPNDMSRAHKSGEKALRVVPLDNYPVYVREGAFFPLQDRSEDAGVQDGPEKGKERVIFTWFHPSPEQASEKRPLVSEMRESVTTGTGLRAKVFFTSETDLVAEVSSHNGDSLGGGFALVGIEKPAEVQIEAAATARCVSLYQPLQKTVRVNCESLRGGVRVTVSGVTAGWK